MARAARITREMVGNCPHRCLALDHYNEDGSCNCPEVEVLKLRIRIKRLEAQVAALKRLRGVN
jgi:hypothetical protein